jgi:putative tricarboxylic transport membrane protein
LATPRSSSGSQRGNGVRIHDVGLGLFFIALAAAMFVYAGTFPAFPGQKYGPSLFPRILGIGIAICGALILWRGWQSSLASRTRRIFVFDPCFSQGGRMVSFLLVPGGIVFYLLLAEPLGFMPTAFMLMVGLFLWFRVRPALALVLAIVITGALQWFFGTMMRVPLPRGLFMQILHGG